jgi:thiol-disulfide isomerase/thioredoxin
VLSCLFVQGNPSWELCADERLTQPIDDHQRRAVMIASLVLGISLLQATAMPAANQNPTSGIWESSTSLSPGDTFPHFKLTRAPGTTVHPMNDVDLKGHRTVFAIIAPFCPHCRKEATVLTGLKAQYAGKLQFIFASVGNAKDTKSFVHDMGLTDCTYLGGLPIAVGANVHHLPLLLFIGDDGKVAYVQHHEVTHELEQAILDAFAEGKPMPDEGKPIPTGPAPCAADGSSTCDVPAKPTGR